MSRAIEPHGTDVGIRTHCTILAACRAHHEVAHPTGRLLCIVRAAPSTEVGVVAHGTQAILSPSCIQPSSEPVRIACSDSRDLLHRLLNRRGGNVRGGNNARGGYSCRSSRFGRGCSYRCHGGRNGNRRGRRRHGGRSGNCCGRGRSGCGGSRSLCECSVPEIQKAEGHEEQSDRWAGHPDGISMLQCLNSLEPT